MSARAWRDRKDRTWRYYKRSLLQGPPPGYEYEELLIGAREGHPHVFDARVRTALLRRDRRARRRGRSVLVPATRFPPMAWALPDADPFEDMRQAARLAGGEQPQRAVLARSQLDRLRPALDEAGALDA